MDYTSFVAQFKSHKDKEQFVKKHITTEYVSYVTKLSEAQKIANIATHILVGDKEIYKKDTPKMYFFTLCRLVRLYTDIEFADDKVVDMYDALSKNGVMALILSSIPESEMSEFRALVDMCVNDIYENERDITSFFDSKFDALSMVFESLSGTLKDTLNSDEVKQILKDKVIQFPGDESSIVEEKAETDNE